MEESYVVHRRRKAAAKNQEKTRKPPKYLEELIDDDGDARAKIEKMVEDTEKMEELVEKPRKHRSHEITSDRETKIDSSLVLDDAYYKQDSKRITETGSSPKVESILEKDFFKNRMACKTEESLVSTESSVVETCDKLLDCSEKTNVLSPEEDKADETKGDDESEDENKLLKLHVEENRSKQKLTHKSAITTCDEEDHDNTKNEPTKKSRRKRTSSKHRDFSGVNKEVGTEKYEQQFKHVSEYEDRVFIKKIGSEFKKQIIPLSNESLIEDLAKAQEEYLKREKNITDFDLMNPFYTISQDSIHRKRKSSIIHTELEKKEIVQAVTQSTASGSWFSWQNFFQMFKKKQVEDLTKCVEPLKLSSKEISLDDHQSVMKKVSQKVTVWEFFRALKDLTAEFSEFARQNSQEVNIICKVRNRCFVELIVIILYCGLGAFLFRFTEGAFETFYKCGVKRVKRDFLDSLWNYSHNLREDDWKSMARKKLMEFEEQLYAAHEAGVHTYSGQKNWTFLNSLVYCLTVITTIGYGHIAPTTTTGRAVTIVYAIFGIPMFLIILADFGKLFTRGIKFLWAFIRRLYYTGSCRKVRRTGPVQEVMKGVQLVYDFATFRRPSQMSPTEIEKMQKHGTPAQTFLTVDGSTAQCPETISAPDTPGTPNMSAFAIDDEFNLPISVAISILLGYIFVGATLYHLWEKEWSFFESFYFVFISMSTIGFGDYVPTHPMYMMCSIVYLVFGLALTSMCINVVQVMLSDQFKQASQKIGATIGFEVVEDDGSIQPVQLQPVEVADVHTSVKDSNTNEENDSKIKYEHVEL